MSITENLKGITVRCEKVKSRGIEYVYELTLDEARKPEMGAMTLYSISVRMSDGENIISEARAQDLFTDLGKASAFFDKLVRNLATPINLAYVVEDERR